MDPDAVIVRHKVAGVPQRLAEVLEAPVINAGDGAHEHPSQALLDMLTVVEQKGQIEGLTVTIIGDIAHSRVARSNIYGFTKNGGRGAGLWTADDAAARHREPGREGLYESSRGARGCRCRDGPAHPDGAARGRLLPERARIRRDLRPRPGQPPLSRRKTRS